MSRHMFRVWDIENKKWLLDENYKEIHLLLDGTICIYDCDYGNTYEDKNDKYIIQHCTGYKDCADKWMYEGDIIGDKEGNIASASTYLKYGAAYSAEGIHEYHLNGEICDYYGGFFVGLKSEQLPWAERYVVGNILENPECINCKTE